MDTLDEALMKRIRAKRDKTDAKVIADPSKVLLDENLMEITGGLPVPLKPAAKVTTAISFSITLNI